MSEAITHKLPLKHELAKHIADVLISSPVDGQVLAYEGGLWKNKPAGGAAHQVGSAEGTTDISTTSGVLVDMPDMSVTLTTGANRVLVFFTCSIYMSVTDTVAQFALYWDADMGQNNRVPAPTQAANVIVGAMIIDSRVVSAGTHTLKIMWRRYIGTGTVYQPGSAASTRRKLIIIELLS